MENKVNNNNNELVEIINQALDTKLDKIIGHIDTKFAEAMTHTDEKFAEAKVYTDMKFDESKRYMGIIAESIEDKIKIVAEGLSLLNEKVDKNKIETDKRLDAHDKTLLVIRNYIIGVDAKLNEFAFAQRSP